MSTDNDSIFVLCHNEWLMAFSTVFEEVYVPDILLSAIATNVPPIKMHTIVLTLEAGFVFRSVFTFITFIF